MIQYILFSFKKFCSRIVIGKVEDPYARQRAKEEVLEEMSRTAPRLTLHRLLNSYYGIYGEHREHKVHLFELKGYKNYYLFMQVLL